MGTLATGTLVAWRSKQEYAAQQRLSRATASVAWAIYTAHAALTVVAALCGRGRIPLPRRAAMLAGWTLMAVGVALYIGGRRALGSLRRVSGLQTDTLVTDGVFRWSRNPQLTVWGLLLLGSALQSRSSIALGWTAAYWAFSHSYLVAVEEPHLARVFGRRYRQYVACTARYVGPPSRVSPTQQSTTPVIEGGNADARDTHTTMR